MGTQEPSPGIALSVLIVSHNVGDYLGAAVDSALTQSRPAHEVIVIDDGSTDGSVELLQSYGDRIRLVQCAPTSIGQARNHGIAVASGEYAVLLDGDDLLLPWTLATFAEQIERHGRPTVVMADWHKFEHPDDLPSQREEARAQVFPDLISGISSGLRFTIAAAVRLDALRESGGFFDAPYGSEDVDLWLRLGTHPGFVYLDGGPFYGYRQHGESTTTHARRVAPGIHHLLRQERRGAYPGGRERAAERRNCLARNVLWGVQRCWKLKAYGAGYRLLFDGLPLIRRAGLTRRALRTARKPLRALVALSVPRA